MTEDKKIDWESCFDGTDDFSDVPEGAAKKAYQRKEPLFTKVPRAWAVALAGARHVKTYPLAIHLLNLAWKSEEQTGLTLANGALAELGVTRWHKWAGLHELEALGLISIDRRIRKSPLIQLLKL
jgi:hypothetical protein